jgi:NCAIR mutase (PurE)-related protein
MNREALDRLLQAVAQGETPAAAAANQITRWGGLRLADAHLDLGRQDRTGHPEVIFGQGKSAEQITAFLLALHTAGVDALATRVPAEVAAAVQAALPLVEWLPDARALRWRARPAEPLIGRIAVVSAGTTDGPVAEEAAVTAETFGNRVDRVRDVGVAGLHRLLSRLPELRDANVLIVVAGMEGALPSVVAGLVDRPVLAVPTSVGYGASFGGLAALLAMLNGCAPGISVVNIDNGFGAAMQASLINRLAARGGAP